MFFKLVNSAGEFGEFCDIINHAIRETNWELENDVEEFKISLRYNFSPAMSSIMDNYDVETLEVLSPSPSFNFESFKDEKISDEEMAKDFEERPRIFLAQIRVAIHQLDQEKDFVIFGRVWPAWMKSYKEYSEMQEAVISNWLANLSLE